MPPQKPGRSRQDYQTPPEFLAAVKQRLYIGNFDIDVAASAENAVCHNYYDESMNGLRNPWYVTQGGWAWCNPPYGNIRDWVSKAAFEAGPSHGASTAMLVPASVGSDWWKECVEPFAYQVFLNGRLTFVGETAPYIKDCALLLYTPWGFRGNEVWNWRLGRGLSELSQTGVSKDQGLSPMSDMRI